MSAEQNTNTKKRKESTEPVDLPDAKRQKASENGTAQPLVSVVILDIEGTTTPISFVADVLFPYVRKTLKEHLENNWEKDELKADIDALRKLAEEDAQAGREVPQIPPETAPKEEIISAVVANVFKQMDEDRKTTALKQLQGHIWDAGYASGELKGEVWDDVVEALKQWKEANVPVFIYSSGSIHAQKLIFGHSVAGDLLPYIKGHFDTTTGMKTEKTSYTKIIEDIAATTIPDIKAEHALFVTDNINEADAAAEAGLQVVLSVRPGNKPLPEDHKFMTITSFKELMTKFHFQHSNSTAEKQ